MRKPKPLKVKFIDLDKMQVIEELHKVYIKLHNDGSISASLMIDYEGKKSLEFKPLQIEPDLMSD